MKIILQHNVRMTSVPTRDGKEFLRRDGTWLGGISKAAKFRTQDEALAFAADLGISDVRLVDLEEKP